MERSTVLILLLVIALGLAIALFGIFKVQKVHIRRMQDLSDPAHIYAPRQTLGQPSIRGR